MKHLIIYALTTSATFLALSNSVNAKDCPPLNTSEIIVDESNGPIKLRTDPATEIQNIPNSGGERAIVNDGEKLLINQDENPQKESGVCFYPVEINATNNPINNNPTVLISNPYWISQAGIKDYQEIANKPAPPAPTPDKQENDDSPGWSLPSWLPGASAFAFNLLVLVLLGFILKKITDILSTLDKNNKKITGSFQSQNAKLSGELQNLQSHIGRNKEHIKQLEELLKTQNGQLYSLADSIKSLSASEPLHQKVDRTEKSVFDGIYSPQSELYQPDIAPVDNQGGVQENQQNFVHDPFYSEVISQFNNEHSSWFEASTKDGVFQKAQMPKYAINGMNPVSPLIELVDHGVYLIFHAADKTFLIPDCTQSKWKRAVTSSLFDGDGKILSRPAQLTAEEKNLWRVIKKGEFTNG